MATGLDATEALGVGHGQLDLGAYVLPAGGGATLDLEAHINRMLSAYAGGRLGVSDGKADYEARGGLRWRF